jgi:hypothetical protein
MRRRLSQHSKVKAQKIDSGSINFASLREKEGTTCSQKRVSSKGKKKYQLPFPSTGSAAFRISPAILPRHLPPKPSIFPFTPKKPYF